MEYYILKCYQEAKNRCSDVDQGVDQGFDRFEPYLFLLRQREFGFIHTLFLIH